MSLDHPDDRYDPTQVYDVIRTIEALGEFGGERASFRLEAMKPEISGPVIVNGYVLVSIEHQTPNGATTGRTWVEYPKVSRSGATVEQALQAALTSIERGA